MGDLIRIVAAIVLIAFLLVIGLPLIWLVIKLFGWLFGGLLMFVNPGILILIVGIIFLIWVICK